MVGALRQTMSISTAMITELQGTTGENLIGRVAKIKTSMSFGFILGTAVGGYLSTKEWFHPIVWTTSLFFFNAIFSLLYFKSSDSIPHLHQHTKLSQRKLVDFRAIKDAAISPSTSPVILLPFFSFLSLKTH